MTKNRKDIIKKNYDFFKKQLPKIIKNHRNEFALIINQKIVSYHKTFSNALQVGRVNYANKDGEYIFSIQEVKDEEENLGFISNVLI